MVICKLYVLTQIPARNCKYWINIDFKTFDIPSDIKFLINLQVFVDYFHYLIHQVSNASSKTITLEAYFHTINNSK